MKPLAHNGRAALARRPDMPKFGEPRKPVKPIEKISRLVTVYRHYGSPRIVLISVPRVEWMERPLMKGSK
jgi:hypothetical protein